MDFFISLQHAYFLDFQNRRLEYISVFMDRLVSWEAVSFRLEQAKAQVAEREREDERKRREEEEETLTPREATTEEIYPDSDADADA